jgi:cell division protease FtsH
LFVGLLLLAMIAWLFLRSGETGSKVPYGYFLEQLRSGAPGTAEDPTDGREPGNIAEVKFEGDKVEGKWRKTPTSAPKDFKGELDESEFHTYLPSIELIPDLVDELSARGVDQIDAESQSVGFGTQILVWMLGPLLLLAFFWFMMRRSSDPMNSGMMGSFIRSPARRFFSSEQRTTFDDVAGMQQAKSELQEVVEFLKTPEKFLRLGAHIPKGVLLMGPPGTGKTLLARAMAGEAGVPFFSINGSEFIQMFVGVGASRVRDLFKTAKENAPCIVFIDEIDAVGRVRGAGVGGGHDEREQTLNQILSEMDGFAPAETVIVIAATNRPDVLDPALLRPGRFDRHITIDRPTKEGRVAILKVHCRKVPLADDVDLEAVAAGSIGFSGADIRNLVNEAALNASRNDQNVVTMEDFESARDRVIMGPRREEILNDHEKEMTAYHEAGHAILAWLLPEADTVHKVTIIPRGRALGVTQLLPAEERYHVGQRRLEEQLVFVMGGRAAEKLVFDEFSAGAEDDIKKATRLARRMVGHWGMSEAVGPVAFRQGDEHPFLGKEMQEVREFSEETARVIDLEVQRILGSAHDRALEMLAEHRDILDRTSQALLEKESLDREDLERIIGVAKATVERNGRPAEGISE